MKTFIHTHKHTYMSRPIVNQVLIDKVVTCAIKRSNTTIHKEATYHCVYLL